MEKHHKFSLWYVLLGVWAVLIAQQYITSMLAVRVVPYSEFLKLLRENRVTEVAITANKIQGKVSTDIDGLTRGESFMTLRVDPEISTLLEQYKVEFKGEIESTFLRDLFSWIAPMLVFVGIWYFLIKRMAGQQPGFMSLGKNKAKIYRENTSPRNGRPLLSRRNGERKKLIFSKRLSCLGQFWQVAVFL